MHAANLHGDRDVALTLMMNGADLDGTDNNGSTPLHHAVNRKYYDLTQILLQRRANPLLPNKVQLHFFFLSFSRWQVRLGQVLYNFCHRRSSSQKHRHAHLLVLMLTLALVQRYEDALASRCV